MSMPYAAPFGPIQILFGDADIVVAVKPAGLLSVPGRGEDKQDCLSERLDALTVHRLDMETSGVMVLARTPAAQSALSRQFAGRTVAKSYVAVVQGGTDTASGEVDLPLITDWPNRPRQKVCQQTGKASLTHWHVLDIEAGHSRLQLTPITGRSHQLRVHMAAIGHPILGDSLYAPALLRNAAPRLLLHAEALSFNHPRTGARQSFRVAAPF